MTPFQLYILLKMDALCNLFIVLAVTIAFIIIIMSILVFFEDEVEFHVKNKNSFINKIQWLVSLFVFSVIAATFLPSTKQMAILYVVPKIINNVQVQELPQRILTLTTEWLEELRPSKLVEETKIPDNNSKVSGQK